MSAEWVEPVVSAAKQLGMAARDVLVWWILSKIAVSAIWAGTVELVFRKIADLIAKYTRTANIEMAILNAQKEFEEPRELTREAFSHAAHTIMKHWRTP